jgi:SAM-dependent methyltransferase
LRKLDVILREWRAAKAIPLIRRGDRLLDIGCFDDYLIRRVASRITGAVGIDPLAEPCRRHQVRILRGTFPGPHEFASNEFDCITALAVLEHVPDPGQLAAECLRVLRPGGRVVLTVPSPVVDRILDVLIRLRLLDGMSAEVHHGFDVNRTVSIFEQAGFELQLRRPFQFGLNHLFVFRKPRIPDRVLAPDLPDLAEPAGSRRTRALCAAGW